MKKLSFREIYSPSISPEDIQEFCLSVQQGGPAHGKTVYVGSMMILWNHLCIRLLQRTNTVCRKRMIYFKELASMIMESGKFEIYRVNQWARDIEEL